MHEYFPSKKLFKQHPPPPNPNFWSVLKVFSLTEVKPIFFLLLLLLPGRKNQWRNSENVTSIENIKFNPWEKGEKFVPSATFLFFFLFPFPLELSTSFHHHFLAPSPVPMSLHDILNAMENPPVNFILLRWYFFFRRYIFEIESFRGGTRISL